MNSAHKTATAMAIIAIGLGTTACGGSSGNDSASNTAGTAPSAGSGTTGSADSSGGNGGAPSSCAELASLATKDLGVSGRAKTVSDSSTTLHCEFGYKNALDFGADLMLWNKSYIDKTILAANEKNMMNPVAVSGVGDAAFSAGSGPSHIFGAVKGRVMVVASSKVDTGKLKTFATDLLAQIG